ncbi:26S proteasome subunit, partial [Melanogaster broomeanus]
IVFIDEIDAIGTKWYGSTSGGGREIQRTMLELLNQLDSFDTTPQLSRRLHTSWMSLNADVDLEEFVMAKDDLSGADIKAVCTEAGLLALRKRRMRVTKADFTTAKEKV